MSTDVVNRRQSAYVLL